MYKGSITYETPMLYAFGFIGLFTIGGLTGLFLATMAIDVHVTDTYFVVAHFHYVMVGGMVMAYLGGIHFWCPKITGRMYPEGWAKFAALVVFVGFNLTFFPQFILGYLGMPRRYHAYAPEFQVLNVMSTAGASILGIGYLIPMIYLAGPGVRDRESPQNPWNAKGLEWEQSPTPPPTFNFDQTAHRHRRRLQLRWRGRWPLADTQLVTATHPTGPAASFRRHGAAVRLGHAGNVGVPADRNHVLRRHVRRLYRLPQHVSGGFRQHQPLHERHRWAPSNTAVLICSSLTMALAVRSAQLGQKKALIWLLLCTMVLGCVFLGVKDMEYHEKWVEHLIPGPGFQYADPHYFHQAQILFFLVFRDDRLPCPAHDRGRRPAYRRSGHGARNRFTPAGTRRSKSSACTGTSSILSGSSCSRCYT